MQQIGWHMSNSSPREPYVVDQFKQINQSRIFMFFYLHNTNLTDQQFIDKLLKHKIKIDAKGNHKFRIATHCDFDEEEIDIVLNSINKILSKESDV